MDINQLDINQLVSQLQTVATLYAEILICILAASILGWLVGLMMQRSRHKRQIAATKKKWKARYESLEDTARAESESLEGQLQALAKETKTLKATNQALTDSLKKNDISIQKARAEAIELNRQHTETHERLQRIVQRKDREINELGKRQAVDSASPAEPNAATDARKGASVTKLIPDVSESELDDADTIAITPIDLPRVALNDVTTTTTKTTQTFSESKPSKARQSEADASLDDTSDLSEFGLEESTVAMDEEALALAQQSFKGQRGD